MEPLHPLTDCENCPLYGNAEFMGYDDPSHKTDIVLIGGMPSLQEKYNGGYENTQAGKLVNKVFKHHGHSPTYYYTTAVLCRPADKKVPAKAVVACRPRVLAEIAAASSGPVVTLGNEAASSVLGRTGIASLRVGPAKRSDWINNDVIPTVNPYVCMRQESQFPNLVADLGKVFHKVEQFKEPKYVVIDDPVEAYDFLVAAVTSKYTTQPDLTIDIECVLDKDESFGHPERHVMLCVGLKINNDIPVVLTDNALMPQVWAHLKRLMRLCNIIAQNGKFDLNGIRKYVGKQKLGFDTMLASYCLDERTGIHGLKYMAQEFLGAPAYDDAIKAYIGTDRDFSRIPRDILYRYNAYDVECTYQLKKLFEVMMEEQSLTDLHAFMCGVSDMLMDVEYEGITIDKEYLEKLVEDFDLSIMTKEHYLSVMAYQVNPNGYVKGDGINPGSWMQIKKMFLDLGIKLDSTDEETMTGVVNYDGKFPNNDKLVRDFATMLLDYRHETKLNGTYITGVKDRLYKGRINSSYLLHGTTTGRLSSRNPNLQNIPRQSPIKKMYVPSRPDNRFINMDYSQAELRTLSYFAKDTYFRDIFNDPSRDVFDELVPVLYPGSDKAKLLSNIWKEQRTMVKTYVYGLNYGRTEYGIAHGFGIPVELARKHMKSFFAVIPQIINWQKMIRAMVKNGEDLVTPFGRHRRYTLLTEENINNIMNEALAFMPQSTASDVCLRAAVRFNKWAIENYAPENRPRIFNLVHDSIMAECHEDEVDTIQNVLRTFMLESADLAVEGYVKFAVDSSVGNSWGELT